MALDTEFDIRLEMEIATLRQSVLQRRESQAFLDAQELAQWYNHSVGLPRYSNACRASLPRIRRELSQALQAFPRGSDGFQTYMAELLSSIDALLRKR
ncbi:MAG: hypothetical protein Q7R81_05365 [Candidatus Peregrinibacteria bacterium]|nr:hypothetical protein [Candidatus Peregrinibacteria bacterium]